MSIYSSVDDDDDNETPLALFTFDDDDDNDDAEELLVDDVDVNDVAAVRRPSMISNSRRNTTIGAAISHN